MVDRELQEAPRHRLRQSRLIVSRAGHPDPARRLWFSPPRATIPGVRTPVQAPDLTPDASPIARPSTHVCEACGGALTAGCEASARLFGALSGQGAPGEAAEMARLREAVERW